MENLHQKRSMIRTGTKIPLSLQWVKEEQRLLKQGVYLQLHRLRRLRLITLKTGFWVPAESGQPWVFLLMALMAYLRALSMDFQQFVPTVIIRSFQIWK